MCRIECRALLNAGQYMGSMTHGLLSREYDNIRGEPNLRIPCPQVLQAFLLFLLQAVSAGPCAHVAPQSYRYQETVNMTRQIR